MARLWMLYDARARIGNCTDEAAVLDTAHSLEEAAEVSKMHAGTDAIWVQYDEKGKKLVKEVILYQLNKNLLCGRPRPQHQAQR